jgi:hypothetical protein
LGEKYGKRNRKGGENVKGKVKRVDKGRKEKENGKWELKGPNKCKEERIKAKRA